MKIWYILKGFVIFTDELVPLVLELDVVGEAALHDVKAVVVAGLDLGDALAAGAGVHPLHGGQALSRGGSLKR